MFAVIDCSYNLLSGELNFLHENSIADFDSTQKMQFRTSFRNPKKGFLVRECDFSM